MQRAYFPLKHVPQDAEPTKPIARRELLGVAAGAALWPRAAMAQQPMSTIGFLHNGSAARARLQLIAFWQDMGWAGFAEHVNVACEYRWAEDRNERLPFLAADLARRKPSLIVAGGAQSTMAAKRESGTIPIVFVSASDPVRSGFVDSLNHPGGNITGISLAAPELLAKRFQIMHQFAPSLTSMAALVNPEAQNIDVQLQYLDDESKRLGIQVQVVKASAEADFASALDEIVQRREAGLIVGNDGFLNGERDRLVALTMHDGIPAAFANREFVEAGGLVSYGPSLIEAYRQAGGYAGRILKGEKPADLAVQNPIEAELVINARTAKSLGFAIPSALLATADDVIE